MAVIRDPKVQRDETIRGVLLGLFVLALALAVLLSERSLFIGDRSAVIPGASIEPARLPPEYARMLDGYGVHIAKLGHEPLLTQMAGLISPRPEAEPDVYYGKDVPPLRFGYSILEKSVAGMPFWPRQEFGHVIYYETPRELVVAPVTDDYLRQVKIRTARPLDDGDFSYLPYMWGWLFVIAALGIGLFELGALRRRREALGII